MNNETPPAAEDDLKATTESFLAGRPVDPVVARRVQERAAAVRQQGLKEFGVQDIGVSIIREARDRLTAAGPVTDN